jgi:hypothetical protein
MKKIRVRRQFQNENKTLGIIELIKDGLVLASLKSLELPWMGNQRRVSCIPAATYEAIPINRTSNGKWALWLQNVPDRSEILIHTGNYTRHILGCILPGITHVDIDGDGITDVAQSQRAMDLIESFVGKTPRIEVEIIDEFLIDNNKDGRTI